MKLEISVKFINEDGSEAIKPVVIDTSVPGFDLSPFPIESAKGNATQLKILWIRTSQTVRFLVSCAT